MFDFLRTMFALSGSGQAIILQGASMTAMTRQQCANSWPSTPITDGQICAISPTVSACTVSIQNCSRSYHRQGAISNIISVHEAVA